MITRGIMDENGNTCGSWSVWDELTSITRSIGLLILFEPKAGVLGKCVKLFPKREES